MFPADQRFPYTAPLGDLGCAPSLFTTLARTALSEDLSDGDATTLATVARGETGRGLLVARSGGVVSGIAPSSSRPPSRPSPPCSVERSR